MQIGGNIEKMKSELSENVNYYLPIGTQDLYMNDLIGKNIALVFKNKINCVACGKLTNKSFGQGFCYNCYISAPESSECILHPDLCKAHLGISRDMQWSLNHCLTTHIVYLANSSNIKVGITRESQIPTRWIDQGANEAIIIASTPNRHIAGTIEKFLMQYYSDKTSWQAMLKGEKSSLNLLLEKNNAIEKLPLELKQYATKNNDITNVTYPLNSLPSKITSLSFDKKNMIEGTLTGIKGQYLIFDNEFVLNIRKHRGYYIELIF